MGSTKTRDSAKRLKKRAEFLRAASGTRTSTPAFVLQNAKPKDEMAKARYGLTATRKLGGAVIRNRARRRLRALAEKKLVKLAKPGDYVLIAREAALTRSFAEMEKDLESALRKISCLR